MDLAENRLFFRHLEVVLPALKVLLQLRQPLRADVRRRQHQRAFGANAFGRVEGRLAAIVTRVREGVDEAVLAAATVEEEECGYKVQL